MKKRVLASALLLSISSIQAEESIGSIQTEKSISSIQAEKSIRWDSASLSYQSIDFDGEKLTGFSVFGTKSIGEDFFIAGGYSSASFDTDDFGTTVDSTSTALSVGLGYRYAVSNNTDLFGIVSYEYIEIDVSVQGLPFSFSFNESENGFALETGIRSLVTDNIELSGSLIYASIADESETAINLSAMYHFTSQFSAGVGYGKSDDADSFSLSAILFF